MDKITFVLTSCGRLDLLRKTIDSFNEFNTYPIEEFIIIDDSGIIDLQDRMREEYPDYTLIFNEERIGQIKSIDKAYSRVKTPYIFHCEDDWDFYKRGFIEDSLEILKSDEKILLVWLRELHDTNGHPQDEEIHNINNAKYKYVSLNWKGGWSGFTFNPGLRRLKDYELIKPYSSTPVHFNLNNNRFYVPELEISKNYGDMGYRTVILTRGSVKHSGWNHHIKND